MDNENQYIKSRRNSNLMDSNFFNNNNNNNTFIEYQFNGILPPPNPLLQRKNIPIGSPKFGRNMNYM
jgi:hypothetical protein